jgi:WD40 repeat protein
MKPHEMNARYDLDIIVFGEKGAIHNSILNALTDKLCWNLRLEGKDPNFIVSGSDAGSIRVWDLKACKPQVILRNKPQEKVYVVRYLHDTVIASATETGIILWDYEQEVQLKQLTGHTNYVSTLETLPNYDLISGGTDRTIRVWRYPDYNCITTLRGHTSGILCLVTISSTLIASASGGNDSVIRVWECTDEHTSTWTIKHVLQGHDGNINCLCYTSKHELLSGGDDYDIRVWNIDTGECVRVLNGKQGWVWSLCETRDGYVISSGQYNRLIAVWDISQGTCVKQFSLQHRGVSSVIQLSDFLFARSADDWCIHIWDINSGETVKKLMGHNALVWSISPV